MAAAKISDAEMEIMEILWKQGGKLTSAQIKAFLPSQNSWKATTLLTLCRRLEEKGIVGVEKEGRMKYFYPLITQEEYQASMADQLLHVMYGGSVKSFMASLYQTEKLSREDIEELKQWLKEV